MGNPIDFILVDDDPVNNFLSEVIISSIYPDARITSFTDPHLGLAYILEAYAIQPQGPAVLFLDLTMPPMSGWEFIRHYENANLPGKDQLEIYILSSSVNPADKEKARQNQFVKDFLEKPLSEEVLMALFGS